MDLATIDWIIIGAFLLVSLAIGLYFRGTASKDLSSFFLGGRNLPWYIAGVSMVATTFAADTPLAVSEFVSQKGIAQNWIWWCFASGGLLTTFFFANLWRRANILTELELIQLRYAAKPAFWLRSFKSLYLGLFINAMIIAWVNLAMASLLNQFFGIPEDQMLWFLFAGMAIAATYSSLSGLLGVAITDFVQFIIAMSGTIILAILVVGSEEVGGVHALKANLPESYFNFFPAADSGGSTATYTLSIGAFFAFAAVQWWASWYPGAEPGGGGYIAQRMMSAKNEKHAVLSTLFFQIAHYCLRPWPWIIVGLCAVYLYSPEINVSDPVVMEKIVALKESGTAYTDIAETDPAFAQQLAADPALAKTVQYSLSERLGYVFTMKDFLPTGLKGLLLVAFLAAYLSTISTQLNWGASFVVNDFYRVLIRPEKEESEGDQKHLVMVSRVATLFIMVFGLIMTTQIDSIKEGWEFLINCGAGLGLVLILRWYWWRINAWSEISATLAPFIGYPVGKFLLEPAFGEAFVENSGTFLFNVAFTTVVWITVTFITSSTPTDTLKAFYERVRPDGNWGPIRTATNEKSRSGNLLYLALCWISSVVLVYSTLFASGKFIFHEWNEGLLWSVSALVGLAGLWFFLGKTRILGD